MPLTADWTDFGTKEELEAKIGNGFKVRVGWTEGAKDTAYCRPMGHGKYEVFVWNSADIRMKLSHLLGMPVHRS